MIRVSFARKTSISTFSGFKDALSGDTILPEVLNRRSEAALVAQTARYFLLNLIGYDSCVTGTSTTIVGLLLYLVKELSQNNSIQQ